MERRREKCCHLAAMRGTESPYSFESIVPRRAVTPTRYRSLKHLFTPERGKSRISGAIAGQFAHWTISVAAL